MEIELTLDLWKQLNPCDVQKVGIQHGAIWRPFVNKDVEFYICYLGLIPVKRCFVLHHKQGLGSVLKIDNELQTAGTLIVSDTHMYISHGENKSLIWASNLHTIY